MKRHSKLGLIIAFLVSVSSSAVGDCKCGRAQKGETTHWGGNMRIEIEQKNRRSTSKYCVVWLKTVKRQFRVPWWKSLRTTMPFAPGFVRVGTETEPDCL